MESVNIKRTLQDDLINCEDDSEDVDELLGKGRSMVPIIYRAIVCYFLEKEIQKNPISFNHKRFLQNHPSLTFTAARKWKASADNGIAQIFEKIKSGSVIPFDEQPNITWMNNGRLLPFSDIPRAIKLQYIDDPNKIRLTEKKRKNNFNKQMKLTDTFLNPSRTHNVDSIVSEELALMGMSNHDPFEINNVMGDHDQLDNNEMPGDADMYLPIHDNELNLIVNRKIDGKCSF